MTEMMEWLVDKVLPPVLCGLLLLGILSMCTTVSLTVHIVSAPTTPPKEPAQ